MAKIHLPDPIYELLPRFYVVAGAVVAMMPLSPLRWFAVVSWVAAAQVTRHRRRRYREAQRRLAIHRRVALRYGKTPSLDASGYHASAMARSK